MNGRVEDLTGVESALYRFLHKPKLFSTDAFSRLLSAHDHIGRRCPRKNFQPHLKPRQLCGQIGSNRRRRHKMSEEVDSGYGVCEAVLLVLEYKCMVYHGLGVFMQHSVCVIIKCRSI